MKYDILIKNGRVVDGTGSPAYNADVGIRNGKIAEIGKLKGEAKRTIDAKGQVVAPGFIDSHTHFDAQLIWDPLCTWSCYHGATTVVTGNCSLGIAPLRPGTAARVLEFLSYVEAIPMEALKTVDMKWHTFGEYLDFLEGRLGLNVGPMVGHTPIRYYVMGEDSQGQREPTAEEIGRMQALIRDALESGALGLSYSMNKGHYDSQGVSIPSVWATDDERFAVAEVLGEMGVGTLQSGAAIAQEEKSRLISRLSEKTGRPFIYSQLSQPLRRPDAWKIHMEIIDESVSRGIRAFPHVSPTVLSNEFNMHNCQVFRGVSGWHEVLISDDDALKMKSYADAGFRKAVHHSLVDWPEDIKGVSFGRNWADTIWVQKTKLDKNSKYQDMSLTELAQATGKGVIDAFLDLVVEEDLDTVFQQGVRGFDLDVMGKLLNYPNAVIGLSDSGAHIQFHSGCGYSSVLLGRWVRKHKIMSVETAVKRLTFDLAQAFGIYDRGLLQPGMAADVVIFDPDTIRTLPEEKITDLPGGAWRLKELAEGVMCTIVNGEVLIEDGKHTGALPGRVLRNSLYRQRQEAKAMGKATSVA